MIIGVPKEIKTGENRVALTPACVAEYVRHGHEVLMEKTAGTGSNIADEEYVRAGARIAESAREVWSRAALIIKVKEPIGPEFSLMQEDQIIFTFFHLAADLNLTRTLINRKIIAVAYETVQLEDGSLPILKAMSEIAGKLAVQFGAQALEAINSGRGILLGGAAGVAPALVVVLGGGTAGWSACAVALGMGAVVRLLDINAQVLEKAKGTFKERFSAQHSDKAAIEQSALEADLLIGTVLIPGARAPRLVSRDLVKKMKSGAAIVDVSVDQGGCIETSRPTTHSNPFFIEEGVIHCCITNFPGTVPLTSTQALSKASLPFGLELADKGLMRAAAENPCLAKGVNLFKGKVTCRQVCEAFGMSCETL
jgi:alanine dehydrogenase